MKCFFDEDIWQTNLLKDAEEPEAGKDTDVPVEDGEFGEEILEDIKEEHHEEVNWIKLQS